MSYLEGVFGWIHRHPRATAAGALIGSALLFYLPLLLGVRTFPDGDFIHHFLPFSIFQARAMAELRLPVWNPYTFGGHPFLADTQAAVFYPVSNALLALTLPLRSDAARLYLLQVEAILETILAGWFVYLLAGEITKVRWAALLAAITWMFSGYLVGYPPLQLAVLRTGIWLPLILWLALRMARSGRPFAWLPGVAAALACAFLAGHPQTFLYVAWVTAAWLILLTVLVWRGKSRGATVRFVAAGALSLLLAAALSAAQWLPSLEFTQLSVRAQADYAFASGGFPLRDTWQMLLPGTLTQFSPIYLGVPATYLVVIALAGLRTRWLRVPGPRGWLAATTLFFAGMALFGLLVSYGDNGPIYALVYRLLPGWNLFRGQERAAYLVALGIALCAGIGASLLESLHPVVRRRIALVWAALLIAGVYAFGLLYQLNHATVVSNERYLAIAVLTSAAAAAVALAAWLPGWSDLRSALLLLLTGVSLFFAGYGINLVARTPQQAVLVAPELQALESAIRARAGQNLGLDGRSYNEFRAYEDYSIRSLSEDLWGSSPLRLARYATFAEDFPLDRWWRLYGVEHVLTWRRDLFEPSERLGEFPQATDTTWLHRLSEFNPRAWIATGSVLASDGDAKTLLADHTFDLETTVVLPPESAALAADPVTATTSIHLNRISPEKLQVTGSTDQPGVLIVSENWMPGWRVESAGPSDEPSNPLVPGMEPGSVQRVDLSLIGVPLPAGDFDFALVYDPASVRVGLWISAAALLALVIASALAWRARRR